MRCRAADAERAWYEQLAGETFTQLRRWRTGDPERRVPSILPARQRAPWADGAQT
jgi:hypothetical protein